MLRRDPAERRAGTFAATLRLGPHPSSSGRADEVIEYAVDFAALHSVARKPLQNPIGCGLPKRLLVFGAPCQPRRRGDRMIRRRAFITLLGGAELRPSAHPSRA